MSSDTTKISLIQKALSSLDQESCKLIAKWLHQHIKALELDNSVFSKNLQELGFSKRTYNVLNKNEIYTIQQLVKTSADWDNIRRLKGVGETVEAEILKKVNDYKKATYLKKTQNAELT